MQVKIQSRILVITALLVFIFLNAQAAEARRLAVVVEATDAMNEVWQGSTRGRLLVQALNLEMNTLPQDVEFRLSWVNNTPILFDNRNWPKLEPNFTLLSGGQGQKLLNSILDSFDWLKENGGGSLLLITPRPGSYQQPITNALQNSNIYCHVLSLDVTDQQALAALALQGGGGFLNISRAQQVAGFLHASLNNAISPARLRIITSNDNNQPINLVLGISRANSHEATRQVSSNRWLQVQAGGYALAWPADSQLPESPPRRTTVESQTTLHVGGYGEILLNSMDGSKSELNWPVAVADANSGRLLEAKRYTPFTMRLPAGAYRAYTTANPRQEWRIALAAGQTVEKIFGPPGSLRLAIAGAWQSEQVVPFTLTALGDDKPSLRGQTGTRFNLAPGRYWMELMVIPPQREAIAIDSEENLNLNTPPMGGLRVTRGLGAPRSFVILDGNGHEVGRGGENRLLVMQPGNYTLKWQNTDETRQVIITPGQINIQD